MSPVTFWFLLFIYLFKSEDPSKWGEPGPSDVAEEFRKRAWGFGNTGGLGGSGIKSCLGWGSLLKNIPPEDGAMLLIQDVFIHLPYNGRLY